MKFNCEKNILQEAISISQKAVTGKSTMPILGGLLLIAQNNSLTIIGTDVDLSIETKTNVNIMEEGKVVVDAKLFGDIIRKLPSNIVEVTSNDTSIIVTCGKSKFSLIKMNANDFPELPNINENMIFKITQKNLKNMIRSTIFAIAQDEKRPILTGVLFEVKDGKLNMVALDGFRLALRSEPIESENIISAVIPGKTLSEISKILTDDNDFVNITFTPNHILFNLGTTKVISRLLAGDFIKYNSIIPKDYNLKVTVKKDELLNCIERASLLVQSGNASLVKLDIQDNVMVITSNSQLGNVREEINIILQGDKLQIAFNSKYLIDLLKIIDDEEIVMELSSSVSPCVVKCKDKDNCTYLVLPVRLMA